MITPLSDAYGAERGSSRRLFSGESVQKMTTEEHEDRLKRAVAWANGEWIRIKDDEPPRSYGHYELLVDGRSHLQWHDPTLTGYRVESIPTGTHEFWSTFVRSARSRGIQYRWSEPILYVVESVNPMNVRVPDGIPGIRDINWVCTDFAYGQPTGICETDGHYLCQECSERDTNGSDV